MVVDQLHLASAEDRHHLARDPLASGVRVLAGQRHERPVVLPDGRVERQQHFARGHARAPLFALAEGEEAGRHGVAEAAAAEVDADPDGVVLVGENVDVMIAAADGTELRARLGAQPFARMSGHRFPRRALEQRMIHGGVVRPILAPHAERDASLDLVGDRRKLLGEGGRVLQIGADRGVAAGDVETDTNHGDLLVVGGDTADRHHVAEMAVGHEGGALGAAGDVLELREGLRFVLAEDRDPAGSHVPTLPLAEGGHRCGNFAGQSIDRVSAPPSNAGSSASTAETCARSRWGWR